MCRKLLSVLAFCLAIPIVVAAGPAPARNLDVPAARTEPVPAIAVASRIDVPMRVERPRFDVPLVEPPQGPSPRQGVRQAVEVVAGYAGFLDDVLIGHTVVGGAFRYSLGRRVSIGPEVVYMAGPGRDTDVFVTGNVTVDFLVPADGPRPGTVSPYVVAGAGFLVQRSRFGPEGFSNTEGAVTGGAGVRVWITERVYAVGEYRAGWEPHTRVDGGIGFAW